MIVGIGIDVIEVARIRGVLERHGDRFLRRIYTEREQESVHGVREQFLAARFAVKEAAFKALSMTSSNVSPECKAASHQTVNPSSTKRCA